MLGEPEKSWRIWGPNSGGGEYVHFKDGLVWFHYYGDAAQGKDPEYHSITPGKFLRLYRDHKSYPEVRAWLLQRGFTASED